MSINVLRQLVNKYDILRSKSKYAKSSAVLSSNSQGIVVESISYCYDLTAVLASSSLTLIFLAVFIDPLLVVFYAISAVICMIVIFRSRKKQTKLSHTQENDLNTAVSELNRVLPSVILFQKPFVGGIFKKIITKWRRYTTSANHFMTWFQLVSNLQSFFIWSPIVASVLILLSTRSLEDNYILLGYIPRLVELMLDVSNLSMKVLDFGRHVTRIDWLNKQFICTVNREQGMIDAKRMFIRTVKNNKVFHRSLRNANFFINSIQHKSGRITIIGENGSGKTNLLFAIKKKFPKRSLLVLSDYRQKLLSQHKSVGQHCMAELISAIKWAQQTENFILLLDEWNANLDKKNAEFLDLEFYALAKTGLIVEVMHH